MTWKSMVTKCVLNDILCYLNHRTGSVALETPPETPVQATDDAEDYPR